MSLSKKLREYCLGKGWRQISFDSDLTSRNGKLLELKVDIPSTEEDKRNYRLYMVVLLDKPNLILNLDTGVRKTQLREGALRKVLSVLSGYNLHSDTARYFIRITVPFTQESIDALDEVVMPMIKMSDTLHEILSDLDKLSLSLADSYAKNLAKDVNT